MLPVQHRAKVTRERLLDAAIETLYSHGYAACSLPELCRRAGVSRGAQQHHFPTKAELLAAAVEHLMGRRHQELRRAMSEKKLDIDEVVDHLWSIYSGQSFYVWLELALAARTDPELKRHLAQVNERFYGQAKDTIREMLDLPDDSELLIDLARFVTSMMDGIAVNRILDDDDERSRASLALFKSALKGGLA
jgi:AcrR family transcriptional regulator